MPHPSLSILIDWSGGSSRILTIKNDQEKETIDFVEDTTHILKLKKSSESDLITFNLLEDLVSLSDSEVQQVIFTPWLDYVLSKLSIEIDSISSIRIYLAPPRNFSYSLLANLRKSVEISEKNIHIYFLHPDFCMLFGMFSCKDVWNTFQKYALEKSDIVVSYPFHKRNRWLHITSSMVNNGVKRFIVESEGLRLDKIEAHEICLIRLRNNSQNPEKTDTVPIFLKSDNIITSEFIIDYDILLTGMITIIKHTTDADCLFLVKNKDYTAEPCDNALRCHDFEVAFKPKIFIETRTDVFTTLWQEEGYTEERLSRSFQCAYELTSNDSRRTQLQLRCGLSKEFSSSFLIGILDFSSFHKVDKFNINFKIKKDFSDMVLIDSEICDSSSVKKKYNFKTLMSRPVF